VSNFGSTSDSASVRRRIAWLAAAVLVLGVAGWLTYRAVAESRRDEEQQQRDAWGLRYGRYSEAVWELDDIGDAGDEATRDRCRHAIKMLELLEPDLYSAVRYNRRAPAWLSTSPAEKK